MYYNTCLYRFPVEAPENHTWLTRPALDARELGTGAHTDPTGLS